MANKNNTITFNGKTVTTGKTAAEGDANGRQLAQLIYSVVPINDSGGQAFKNAFVEVFLHTSGRARQAASAVLGKGSPKSVQADPVTETSKATKSCCHPTCCD